MTVQEIEALKAHAEVLNAANLKNQTALDAEIQAHKDTRETHEDHVAKLQWKHAVECKKFADAIAAEVRAHGETKAAAFAEVTDLKLKHEAAFTSQAKQYALALLKEKHRVDKIEFEARLAAEAAAIQQG